METESRPQLCCPVRGSGEDLRSPSTRSSWITNLSLLKGSQSFSSMEGNSKGCQPMVTAISDKSVPTGLPSFGCHEEGNMILCKTAQLWKQHDCEAAGARPLCNWTALPWSALAPGLPWPLVWPAPALPYPCSALPHAAKDKQPSRSVNMCSPARGELAYMDRRPGSWSLIGVFSILAV